MQTLTIKVKDDFMIEFMNMIDTVKDNVIIQKDKNLELDSYFYERQKKLHQIRNDVKNGTMRMLSEDEADEEIEFFFKELENNI